MTPRGWIAVLSAAVLVLAMALGGVVSKGCVDTATFELRDAAAVEQIAERDETIKVLKQSARAAVSKATESDTRANVAEKGQQVVVARLKAVQRNLARRPNPKTFEEAMIANRDMGTKNDLLQQALDLANQRANAKDEALVFTGSALADTEKALAASEEINAIQAKRIKGYQKQAKRDRRIGIVKDVVFTSAALAAGIGIGKAI